MLFGLSGSLRAEALRNRVTGEALFGERSNSVREGCRDGLSYSRSSPAGVVEWACRATSAIEHARGPMAHNRIRNSNVSLGSSACHILRSLSEHLHVAEAIA